MFSWIYSSAITVLAIAYLPKLLYQSVVYKKYRHTLLQRLGLNWPVLPEGPVMWVHAVSVGETRAIAPLARLLMERYPGYRLVVSSVTETGHAEAQRLLPEASAHVFLPLDWRWVLLRVLKSVDVRLVVLSEGDLWWRFMDLCHSRGAKIALVNGKLSERSLRRWRWWWCRPLRERLCALLDLCCVQNTTYAERFKQLGVAEARIQVGGNLKFDIAQVSAYNDTVAAKLALEEPLPPLLVVGSTHEGEEELILEALEMVWHKHPWLRLVIVPRHPQRFDKVAALLARYGSDVCRWSQSCQPGWRILLVDTMGVLPSLYPFATLAIVGGSFIEGVGGHNIIEPCLVHTPVLFGPYMSTQAEMVALIHSHQAGLQVANGAELAATIDTWLQKPSVLNSYRAHCQNLAQAVQGTTERTYQYLQPLLP